MIPTPQPLNLSTSPLAHTLTNAFRGQKVFVTGHTGFKGSWLCEWLLLLGAEITGYSLPPPTDPSLFHQLGLTSRLTHIQGDVRDAAALRKALLETSPDFVFHLAAQPLVRLSYAQPVETWETNVMGTIHLLQALQALVEELRGGDVEKLSQPLNPSSTPQPLNQSRPVVAVMVTTDKVYENREWLHGYREEDPLGGYDPYSSSKGAAEIAIAAWRRSFFDVERFSRGSAVVEKLSEIVPQPLDSSPSTPQPLNPSTLRPLNPSTPPLLLASARAGNVIGGGDWALDRIVPDAMRALASRESIPVRNPRSTRPWQHVLEPLSGYLLLASRMAEAAAEKASRSSAAVESLSDSVSVTPSTPRPLNPSNVLSLCSAFNFGPPPSSNRPVEDLVREILQNWAGEWEDRSDPQAVHEAGLLNLSWDKSFHLLGWEPRWDFAETVRRTADWYRETHLGSDPAALTRRQILEYVAP